MGNKLREKIIRDYKDSKGEDPPETLVDEIESIIVGSDDTADIIFEFIEEM